MLSFSTPFHLVRQLPQTILNDYFLSLPNSTWFFVKGGVYAYMQDIIQKSKMQIICDAHDIKISRCENEVKIGLGGTFTDYHKVIIATTPGSVKNLLSDMTEQEHKIFRDFEDQSFKTMAHKDISIYNPYKSVYKTPMDLFYKYNSDSIGYNTYLNNVYKLQTKEHYNFAYNLDQDINKSDIIHKAHHIVPKYNLRHDSKMEILKHINGRNNTFFAGAYTSNGLHEGATISAIKISEILGGINIA
jgi:predicted NAD/FAD-binding protein